MHIPKAHTLLAMFAAAAWALAVPATAAEPDGEIFLDPEEPAIPQWGYDGDVAPDFWGSLLDEAGNVAFPTCGTGTEQSPINISRSEVRGKEDLRSLQFNYVATPLVIENLGRTIEVPYHSGSTLQIGGESFELLQFHFHGPSEHAFEGGGRFVLELHAVHQNAAGALAVLGILIRRGAENPGFPTGRFLAQALPRVEGVEFEFPAETVNLADLLPPSSARAFRYAGSLTTPPCSEGVQWLVLDTPVEFSDEQVDALRTALGQLRFASPLIGNSRPLQPLNGRVIEINEDEDDD